MKRILLLMIVATSFFSCKKESNKSSLDVNTLELKYDATHQFVLKSGDNTVSGGSWSSSDESVGTVDDKGRFIAKKIGETIIKGNDASCVVTVKPYFTTCAEPYLIFGSTASQIKANDKRIVDHESIDAIILRGENSKLKNVYYGLTAGKSTGAILIFNYSSSIVSEVDTFLKERYTSLGASGDYIFYTDYKNVSLGITVNANLGFTAIYVPYSGKGVTSVKALSEKMKEIASTIE